jgi:stalled ribosome rescue protein Dom34
MVSNDVLHSSDLEIRRRTISLMEDVERKKGKVKIFMAEHNTKIWLKSLGGIAALLRFKV